MSEAYLGEIRIFAGNYAPEYWLSCDGQLLAINQYEALFSLVGTTYGGDGVTTFAIPNLKGRAPAGAGQGTGLTSRVLGQQFGVTEVTLTAANFPAHTHTIAADGAAQATTCNATGHLWGQIASSGAGGVAAYVDGATNPALVTMAAGLGTSSGANYPHDNVQPYTVINMIMCTMGTYPERN